ncbi:response regulator transcription factor [Psychroflexus aestuariivivens]|uniref:response regulator transcription factor n=1 Tax=Psychroflexus aestuariivivens TaxID=1795040 RepID=UPI000FDBBBC7|nr:response regulator transcription factor [Psychroflexus aestuariivivens]
MIKIAIADDHQALIDGVKLKLDETDDIQLAFTANNGQQFLDHLKTETIDMAIIDLKMPKMDGIQLTKEIKTNFEPTKVIAFSMFDQADAINKMKSENADGYILKTSSLDKLIQAIYAISRGEKYYDESINGITYAFSEETEQPKNMLSKSERQILELIASGKTSAEIADIRQTAISTIDTHRRNMTNKLRLSGKGELLRYAMDQKYKFD